MFCIVVGAGVCLPNRDCYDVYGGSGAYLSTLIILIILVTLVTLVIVAVGRGPRPTAFCRFNCVEALLRSLQKLKFFTRTSVISKPNRHCLGNCYYSQFSISKSNVKQTGTVWETVIIRGFPLAKVIFKTKPAWC